MSSRSEWLALGQKGRVARAGSSVCVSCGGVLIQLTRVVKPSLEAKQSVLQAKAVKIPISKVL